MSKRRINVSSVHKMKLDSDSDFTLSENDDVNYEPVIKKNCSDIKYQGKVTRKKSSSECNDVPLENNEHSYSCFPVFTNVSDNNEKRDFCDSCESEDANEKFRSEYGQRLSERSTSSESVNCGKGKFMPVNSQKVNSKRRPKCFTKNAVMARMNRQRKKEYVASLEENITNLKSKNNDSKKRINEQQEEISSLKNEILYLKSVLSNSKEIGVLLRRVCGEDRKLKISSSLLVDSSAENDEIFSREENLKDGIDFNWPMSPSFDTSEMDKVLQCDSPSTELNDLESGNAFGVCLHVANKQVSLEFCAACHHSASSVLSNDIFLSIK